MCKYAIWIIKVLTSFHGYSSHLIWEIKLIWLVKWIGNYLVNVRVLNLFSIAQIN